jgi:hypothetical protein
LIDNTYMNVLGLGGLPKELCRSGLFNLPHCICWHCILPDNSNWKAHIPKRPIFDEELHIEDDDNSLVENGEQFEF